MNRIIVNKNDWFDKKLEILEIERETKTLYILTNGDKVKKEQFDNTGYYVNHDTKTEFYKYKEETFTDLESIKKSEIEDVLLKDIKRFTNHYGKDIVMTVLNDIVNKNSSTTYSVSDKIEYVKQTLKG